MKDHIEVTTYFLEMFAPPSPIERTPPIGFEVEADAQLSVAEYRRLYHSVGAPWLWYERTELDDEALSQLIHRDDIVIHLLRYRGELAGYSELKRTAEETQILYFGLVPERIGAGLGGQFLTWTAQTAFAAPIRRLWVHTCSLDHTRALSTYEKTGFCEFRRHSGWVRIPQAALALRSR